MRPELPGPAHDGSGVNEPDHVPAIEHLGNELAARTQELATRTQELEHQKHIVGELLKHVGKQEVCPKCLQQVLLIWHIDQGCFRRYNSDGSSHVKTCSDRQPPRRKTKDVSDGTSKRQ